MDVTKARRGDEDTATEFVTSLYRAILKREPDEGGLRHHVALYRDGEPLLDMMAAFLASHEYRRLQADRLAAAKEYHASRFSLDYDPPGEAGRSYRERLRSGFYERYCGGRTILDVGFSGYENPEGKTGVPGAIGIDINYPGYDGVTLPFADASVDTVFSSHCLEHIVADHAVIRDWHRVLKIGGFIVCIVPSQALYEMKRFLPSLWNTDHKRMYSPSSLLASFETALDVNSYRVRHLAENDRGYHYEIGPDTHPQGRYEIELVIEKIPTPSWTLA